MRLLSLIRRATPSVGKRTGQHLVAQVSGPNPSHLLYYVKDRNTGNKLLVDTGAQISVFPASAQERRRQKTEPLIAANGSKIHLVLRGIEQY